MNVREFFSKWDNPFPALGRIAINAGFPQGTEKEMLESFGDFQITEVKEEIVGDSYQGRMKVYTLVINGKEIRVF